MRQPTSKNARNVKKRKSFAIALILTVLLGLKTNGSQSFSQIQKKLSMEKSNHLD